MRMISLTDFKFRHFISVDHVKDVKSIKCWSKMSAPISNKMKIAIGNHDAEFSKIYKQIIAYNNLTTPYYSNYFTNIHFISLST